MSYNINFKNILVPVDGSEFSIRALEYAVQIVKRFNSKLIALHVVPSSIRYDFFMSKKDYEMNSPFNQVLQLSYIEALKWFEDVKEKIDVEFTTDVIIAEESIVKEIIEYSERENIDLIVIGTRGRTGFKKVFLGSVASGVLNFAHCPVLIVK
ncbi:MAG TPA: universal stress protein [Nitrososphaeraceae archaeon]|nr:universal stress protein [Nitrososphaeraceae archaeon]